MSRTAAATRVTPERWQAVRAALREAGDRFADLTLSAPDSAVLATKDWSVADTAAHVTGVALNYTAAIAEDGRAFPIPDVRPYMLNTTVDNIHTGMNVVQLQTYTERDPARLAERLRAAVGEILDMTADDDPERILPWLGNSQLPVAGVLAHMMNELLVHGWDIATSIKVPWPIAEEHAGLFFDLFLVEIIRNGYGSMLDDDRPVRQGRITVEFRSAYTTPVTIVLDSGEATAVEANGDCDVRIRFRPTALNLVLWHRISHLRAVLSGSLLAWGRRPWLLPAFLRKVRLP